MSQRFAKFLVRSHSEAVIVRSVEDHRSTDRVQAPALSAEIPPISPRDV
jgi:hypothetical protein